MDNQITLETLNAKLDETLAIVREMGSVTVINGGNIPVTYTRKNFDTLLWNRVTFKALWTKFAAVITTVLSILTIINIILIWSR